MSDIHYLLPFTTNSEFFSPSLSTSTNQCDLPDGWMTHLILNGVRLLVSLSLLGHGCCNFLFIVRTGKGSHRVYQTRSGVTVSIVILLFACLFTGIRIPK